MKAQLIFLLSVPGILNATVKTSVSSGNWSSPSTWSPSGVPGSSDKVRLYHDVTLDVNYSANDTVFVYASLSIAKNKTLQLYPGTMVLVNNSNYNGRLGTMGLKAAITGNYEFQRYIQRCDGYSLYGSPFTTALSNADWYYCHQCMGNWSNIYRYIESTKGTLDYGYSDQLNTTLTRGEGFFYWFQNYNGGKNFPRTIALKGSTDFTQSFDFNISYTKDSGPANDGFNLVANPFPGTVDWLAADWSKKKINNAIYVWNSCSGSYASFAGGVGVNGGSRYIPAMQGFWVQSNAANAQLSVGSGAMVPDAAAELRTSADDIPSLLRITLGYDEIAVRLDDSSGRGFDPASDALAMITETSRLYTTADSADFSINTLGTGDQCIALRTRAGGTLRFTGSETFSSDYKIILVDRLNQTMTEIGSNTGYIFDDTTMVTYASRFELCFARVKDVTGVSPAIKTENNFVVAARGDRFSVNVKEGEARVMAYTLEGKLVYEGETKSGEVQIPSNGEPLFIRISQGNNLWCTKIAQYAY